MQRRHVASPGPTRARPRILFGLTALISALWPPVAIIHAQSAVPAPLAGWSSFQIKKTPAALAETARLAGDSQSAAPRTAPRDVQLPPQHDVLRVSTGIGYLEGADL